MPIVRYTMVTFYFYIFLHSTADTRVPWSVGCAPPTLQQLRIPRGKTGHELTEHKSLPNACRFAPCHLSPHQRPQTATEQTGCFHRDGNSAGAESTLSQFINL